MRARGFTLFEVMAAVLVLGIIFPVLADKAMQGLRSEGTNRRRGEASLLADRRLAELEATLAAGGGLEPGRDEQELPPFLVTTETTPIDVLELLPPPAEADPAGTAGAEALEPTPLLAMDASGASRLQRVTVTVEWDEAGLPYRVVRNTFAFDASGLEEFFPDEGGVEEEGPTDDELENIPEEVLNLPGVDELLKRLPRNSR